MSVLTKEQIADLATHIRRDYHSQITDIEGFIQGWNEKQQSIDWDSAPEKAVQAVINSYWVDINGNTFGIHSQHSRRPTTPHPHAEMLMKYAQVSARRTDPWVEFELAYGDTWQRLTDHPTWNDDTNYRYIGESK